MRRTKQGRIASLVTELAEPIVAGLGLEFVAAEYVKEGGEWYVRVYIDKPGGVSHADCQAVSAPLEARLDELDPIPQSYYLEVSSPGLERPLRTAEDFARFRGSPVALHCYHAVDGRKLWQGTLVGQSPAGVQLETDSGAVTVPHEAIARAHLVYEPNGQAGGRRKS